ncbi:MAG: CpaF family protein [Steroidobacteraceae bacterium]
MNPTTLKQRAGIADAIAAGNDKIRSLTPLELEWKQRIHDKLLQVLDLSMLSSVEESKARSQIREVSMRLIVDAAAPLSMGQRQFIVRRIEDEVLGHGPLEQLLADDTVSDILVNGAKHVYVERRGKLELTEVHFHDDQHLLNIIDRIVSAVGRRVDESSPMVDARLADGSRVNAIIPPLALDGPILSIRRFGVELLSIEDLLSVGTLTPAVAEVLRGLVAARMNLVISGGTGAGKTTLLNILSSFIPRSERIVTIEDSAELQLQQPHVVRLETRPPNIEGRGEVNQRDLVRNSLRMRPDRIVIGEVRGAEALDMLQAMNTGHEGSLTTVHSNSPRDAFARIETMVSMTGLQFPIKALRAQMASAIHAVVQVERGEDGKRRLVSLQEINGMEGDIITMSEIFAFRRTGLDDHGAIVGALVPTGVVPSFHKRLSVRGINLPHSLYRQ